jgi:hypothetical protein
VESGEISRPRLAGALKMERSLVGARIHDLIADGLVVEVGKVPLEGARVPVGLLQATPKGERAIRGELAQPGEPPLTSREIDVLEAGVRRARRERGASTDLG